MKKKIVSLVVVLAMIVCLAPGVAGVAKAGQYDYPLTFDAQGGHIDSTNGPATLRKVLSQSVYVAGPESVKHTAYKSGAKFLGWYTTKSGGTRVNKNYVGAPSTVYAQWLKYNYVSSGQGYVSTLGGTVTLNISESGGHYWSIKSNCSWATPKISGNLITVTVGENKTTAKRTATITLSDSYGNSSSFTVWQNPGDIFEAPAINSVFTNVDSQPKYANIISAPDPVTGPDKPLDYNMRYVKWFRTGSNLAGCCTDSAMMDLLNRRLARDRVLSTKFYFDVRDVLEGMSCSGKANDDWRYDASGVYSELCSNGAHTRIYVSGWKYELSYNNNEGTKTTTYFTNNYGSQYGAKTYNVKFEYGAKTADQIKQLLREHPEGIFLYSNVGGAHAVVVVGFENNHFKYIDNAAGRGILSYKDTVFVTGHGQSTATETNGTLFRNIISIAYVTN